MWSPPKAASSGRTTKDLLATSGDYLRVWSIDSDDNKGEMKALLNNNKHTGKQSQAR